MAGNIRNGVNIFGVVGNFVGWVDSTYPITSISYYAKMQSYSQGQNLARYWCSSSISGGNISFSAGQTYSGTPALRDWNVVMIGIPKNIFQVFRSFTFNWVYTGTTSNMNTTLSNNINFGVWSSSTSPSYGKVSIREYDVGKGGSRTKSGTGSYNIEAFRGSLWTFNALMTSGYSRLVRLTEANSWFRTSSGGWGPYEASKSNSSYAQWMIWRRAGINFTPPNVSNWSGIYFVLSDAYPDDRTQCANTSLTISNIVFHK